MLWQEATQQQSFLRHNKIQKVFAPWSQHWISTEYLLVMWQVTIFHRMSWPWVFLCWRCKTLFTYISILPRVKLPLIKMCLSWYARHVSKIINLKEKNIIIYHILNKYCTDCCYIPYSLFPVVSVISLNLNQFIAQTAIRT